MKKLWLIKNPELFQGEKNLKINKKYFEGWYFKNTNGIDGISFIPGINIDGNERKAFIQIITTNSSYFINYSIDDFEFNFRPFYIKIANNFFSLDNIHIDIVDSELGLIIYGDINYSNSININTNIFNPNIMGAFSYIPFMECNHAILSMKNKINGCIYVNNQKIEFDDGIGYIEKDWGYSFPKSYIWCQANNFSDSDASFMLSIADIPFKIFNFRGFICSLIVDDIEYRFATYNGAKIVKYEVNDNLIDVILKKGNYYLNIKSESDFGHELIAPVAGKMEKNIIESINALITIILKKEEEIIFSDTSINCGLEIVLL